MTEERIRILIVDDEPRVLRFVEISLRLRGFDVITMTSGKQALEQFGELNPDVMLLDIIMPEIDGFEVLRQLRSFSRIPVIAYSASELNQHEAIRCGASDFIRKPFYPDEIMSKINGLIGNSGQDGNSDNP